MARILNFRNAPARLLPQCLPRLRQLDTHVRASLLHPHFMEYDFSYPEDEVAIHLRWPAATSRLALFEADGRLCVEHGFRHAGTGKRTTIVRYFDTAAEALHEWEDALLIFLSQFEETENAPAWADRLPVVKA